jgi:hypothetical protein
MSPDYRSEAMHSREGEGRAKRAYELAGGPLEGRGPTKGKGVRGAIARQTNEDVLGFWLLWHTRGGFDGLERFGMHRATIFRKINTFRQVYGVHPDVFELPGIKIDLQAFWAGAAQTQEQVEEARRRLRKEKS